MAPRNRRQREALQQALMALLPMFAARGPIGIPPMLPPGMSPMPPRQGLMPMPQRPIKGAPQPGFGRVPIKGQPQGGWGIPTPVPAPLPPQMGIPTPVPPAPGVLPMPGGRKEGGTRKARMVNPGPRVY